MGRRRIVVANSGGKSTIVEDQDGLTNAFATVPGFDPIALWGTPKTPPLNAENQIALDSSVLPAVGGTTLFVVTFPSDSAMLRPDFNPGLAGAEYMERLPGD